MVLNLNITDIIDTDVRDVTKILTIIVLCIKCEFYLFGNRQKRTNKELMCEN